MVEILVEAPDAVTLRLELVDCVDGFLPGQYYNVRFDVPGRSRPVQRAYSVGSSPVPDPSTIDLGVREVPGGLISPRLVRDRRVGQHLEVRGPAGRFTWTGQDDQPVLLVGAGSGVVPLMAMIRYAVAVGREIPMCMVCSAITYEHALYREELTRLSSEHDWLQVIHCVTRDTTEPRANYHRRIDREMLAELFDGHVPPQGYVCGPPVMVTGVEDALIDLGVDPTRIHSEKYD